MKLYEALYNPCYHESTAGTLSIHRTKEGAEKAIAKHKAVEKAEHDKWHTKEIMAEDHEMMRKCGFPEEKIKEYDDDRASWPEEWQWWGVREIEVQE